MSDANRYDRLARRLWHEGYQLMEPQPGLREGYAIMNASETPKPPMGDTRCMTLDEVEAWIGERS